MTNLFLSVLSVSISVGLIAAILILLTSFLNKRYAAKWKYWIWIFLALRLLLPFSGEELRSAIRTFLLSKPQTASQLPENETIANPNEGMRVVVEMPVQMTKPIPVQSKVSKIQVTLLDLMTVIWLIGAAAFLAAHLISYLLYKNRLTKSGAVIEDDSILNQLQALQQELAIKRSVPAMESSEAASPMIIGFLHPVLVLPKEQYSTEELYFILKHELVHQKRRDTYFKLLLVMANAVHWFNPLIWLMQKEAVIDMELSCDERVMQGSDYALRKAYTETLLSTLHKQCKKRTALSTQFYGGKQVMKRRFRNILQKTGKKNGICILLCVILFTIGLGTLMGCTAAGETKSDMRTPTEAEEDSANDIPSAERISTESENDGAVTDIPDTVWQEAQAWTTEEYEYHKRVSPGNHYSDQRIESLSHCYTYEDFEGMVLQVYRMNIEFLSDMPESVFLAGGMTMTEDGWVVPDYPNSRYLIFRQDGETLTLLIRLFENDCDAGDNIFTKDLKHQWELQQLPQDTPMLTFTVEGEAEEVAASLFEGNGYTLCLPDGGWYPTHFEIWADVTQEWEQFAYDAWAEWNNEDVRLWTVRFEGMPYEDAEKKLLDSGYALIDDRFLRQEGELIYGVELKRAETDTWGVCYSYPVDAEEGWGTRLRVIADTFTISE